MPRILPYANLFPTLINDIFSRSVYHSAVHHSILSISSILTDLHLHRPLDRFYNHYITAIRTIQKRIQDSQIDEDVAIAVFLIMWIDGIRTEMDTSRKHVKGLYLILQKLRNNVVLSPLLIRIWKVAVKVDWTTSFFLLEEPIFPTSDEDIVFPWWMEISESALAAFELDNLVLRACRVAFQARSQPNSQHKISKLQDDVQAWKLPSIIQSYDPFHVNLLNAWRALNIYLSLILDPATSSPQRLAHAIEISRTLDVFDRTQPMSSRIWIMVLAGVALREVDPDGKWISKMAEQVATVFPVMKDATLTYVRLCCAEGNFWGEMERARAYACVRD